MTMTANASLTPPPALLANDLLLCETPIWCSIDLQCIMRLFAQQIRHATGAETHQTLNDALERVGVPARPHAALDHQVEHSLGAALRQICEALYTQCEPRFILISLELATEAKTLSASRTTALTLVVYELARNAIKHAFKNGADGHISIKVRKCDACNFVITVDDDGVPFPDPDEQGAGFGLALVKRLVASAGGVLILPSPGLKIFKIRVPVAAA